MATPAELLAQDSQKLRQALGLDPREARLEVQILLCHALGVARSWLIGHDRDALPEPAAQTYAALLTRRLAGEPIAYIVGSREFFGLEFKTTPAVLIPRPETELLVELALARIPENQPCKVLDLGTGSGAIAISIARNRPLAAVTAVDQSLEALAVARENAARLEAPNLRLLHSDWFGALDARNIRPDRFQSALCGGRRPAPAARRRALRALVRAGLRGGRPGRHPPHRRRRAAASQAGRLAAVRARLQPGRRLPRNSAPAGIF